MITEFIVKINDNNVYLDVYDDIPISLNYNIADISNIESKNSSYSKTITLPDSKVNRDAFKQIFQLNSDSQFDPTRKSRCWILKDTVVQFEGNLQLTNVTYDNNFNVNGYEAVIYSDNDGFYLNIGEKYLTDLNLTMYDHTYDYPDIINSFTASYDNGYYYPLIDYNLNLSIGKFRFSDYKINHMYPAVYVKAIIDEIFLEAGYNYTSDFFNSPEYKRLVIPFTNKSYVATIYNLTTDSIDNIFIANKSATTSITDYDESPVVLDISGNEFPVVFRGDAQHNVDTYDPNNFYNNSTYVYSQNNSLTSVISTQFIIDFHVLVAGGSSSFIYAGGTGPNGGGDTPWLDNYGSAYWAANGWSPQVTRAYDDVRIVLKRSMDANGNTVTGWGGAPSWDHLKPSGWPSINIGVDYYGNGATSEFSIKGNIQGTQSIVTQTGEHPFWDLTGRLYSEVLSFNPLRLNEEVKMFVYRYTSGEIDDTVTILGLPTPTPVKLKYIILTAPEAGGVPIPVPLKIGTRSVLSAIVVRSDSAIGGDINLSLNLPTNVKQKDFLSSISKMFNLYFEPEKDKINSFIVEPRDDYYRKYQVIKDWSRKLDISKSLTSIFTSNTQMASNLFTYKEDKDFYNADYKNATKEIYGQHRYDIDNQFIKGEKKIELLFSPTINNLVTGETSMYAPQFINNGSNNSDNKFGGVNPRILYSKPITLSGTNSLTGLPYTDIFKIGTYSLSIYPYAGPVNDPLNPTYSVNFGQVNNYYRGYNETDNNLFKTYYQNQMSDISDKNSRIVTAYFNLNSNDVSQFKFSDIIMFRLNGADGYYRVNKIIDYDPTVNMTTKVELIKANNYNVPRITTYPVTTKISADGNGGFITPAASPFFTQNSLIIGNDNTSGGSSNIVTGVGNKSTGNSNLVTGDGNTVFGTGNIVVGSNLNVTSNNSLVIGNTTSTTTIGDGAIYMSSASSNNMVLSANNINITSASDPDYIYNNYYDNDSFTEEFINNADGITYTETTSSKFNNTFLNAASGVNIYVTKFQIKKGMTPLNKYISTIDVDLHFQTPGGVTGYINIFNIDFAAYYFISGYTFNVLMSGCQFEYVYYNSSGWLTGKATNGYRYDTSGNIISIANQLSDHQSLYSSTVPAPNILLMTFGTTMSSAGTINLLTNTASVVEGFINFKLNVLSY